MGGDNPAPRSPNARVNLILVRLSCCCGLRVSEIAGLQVADVRCEVSRPHLRIRRGASKGGRSRIVPLWWDAATLRGTPTCRSPARTCMWLWRMRGWESCLGEVLSVLATSIYNWLRRLRHRSDEYASERLI